MNRLKAAWILCFLAMALAVQSASADGGITWYTADNVAVPDHIIGAIEDAIIANPPEVCQGYAITGWDVIEPGKKLSANVACLVNVPPDGRWHLEDNMAWGGTYYVTFTGAVKNLGFVAEVYDPIPRQLEIDYIVKLEKQQKALEEKSILDVAGANAADEADDNYGAIFPMLKGYKFLYGALGVHDPGFKLANAKAIDMMTDGDTAAGNAPNMVYASVAGEVTYVCNDNTSKAAIIGPYLYAHLDPTTPITKGKVYAAGDPIGLLVKGEFDANCGYAKQDDNFAHLHWGFPVGDQWLQDYYFMVEDYKLNITNNEFTKGTTVYKPGDWIPINWDRTTSPPEWISPEQNVNFWDIMFSASDIAIVAFGSNLPLYESSFSGSVASNVQKALTATYILIGSTFDMTTPLIAITIVILAELARLVIGAYKLIKSLVPMVG